MTSDDDGLPFYHGQHKPPTRQVVPTPGERLWELQRENVTWSSELILSGESYGWESRVLRNNELSVSRRFLVHESAIRWAEQQHRNYKALGTEGTVAVLEAERTLMDRLPATEEAAATLEELIDGPSPESPDRWLRKHFNSCPMSALSASDSARVGALSLLQNGRSFCRNSDQEGWQKRSRE